MPNAVDTLTALVLSEMSVMTREMAACVRDRKELRRENERLRAAAISSAAELADARAECNHVKTRCKAVVDEVMRKLRDETELRKTLEATLEGLELADKNSGNYESSSLHFEKERVTQLEMTLRNLSRGFESRQSTMDEKLKVRNEELAQLRELRSVCGVEMREMITRITALMAVIDADTDNDAVQAEIERRTA